MCVCGGSADLTLVVEWGSSAHALQVFLGKWCLFRAPCSAPFCPRGGEESEWSVDEWNALPLVDGESPGPDPQRSAGQTYADAGDGRGDTHDSGDEMEEDEDAVSDRYDAAEAVMFNVSESRSSVRREARALDDAGEMD